MPSSAMSDRVIDPATDDVPTPVRISAIEYYIRKEPIFNGKVKPLNVKVKKRDGTTVDFPSDVFEIACLVHKDQKDALKIGKSDILTYARAYFNVQPDVMPQKTRHSSISPAAVDMAGQAIKSLLELAYGVESKRESGDKELAAELDSLAKQTELEDGDVPPVVPYSLVNTASQLAEVHPTLVKMKPKLDKIIQRYQRITIGS